MRQSPAFHLSIALVCFVLVYEGQEPGTAPRAEDPAHAAQTISSFPLPPVSLCFFPSFFFSSHSQLLVLRLYDNFDLFHLQLLSFLTTTLV